MEKMPSAKIESNVPKADSAPELIEAPVADGAENGERGNRSYEIDGINVEVDWTRYLPDVESGEKLEPADKGVIYFPGWAMPSDAESSEKLSQTLAQETVKDGGSLAISVTTRAENISNNSLPTEAKAIAKFIEEMGLKEVVLAGQSRGGQKAANVAVQLQNNNPDIKVNGLLLFCPVGLYEQGNLELTRKFWGHAFMQGVQAQSDKKMTDTYAKLTRDTSSSLIDEIKRSKLDYPARVTSEIKEMAKSDPAFREVTCPVILIQGKDDPISSPEKTIEVATKAETADYSIRKNSLIDNIFTNSPFARQIVGKEMGNHGLSNYRDAVAKVGLYLLRRHQREQ